MNQINNKIINYIIFIFFCLYFFIGTTIFNDYGLSIDEPFHRTSGFYWYLWIVDLFFGNSANIENLKTSFNQMEWSQNFLEGTFLEYGVIFDLLAAYIETKLGITNYQDIYYLKHFMNFCLFYASSIVFFFLIKNRFKNNLLSFIAVLFYITSPRIFAESFYNCKDIVFMSFIVFCIFFGTKLLEKINIQNLFLFCLFSALATSVRSMGIFSIILVLVFICIECLEQKKISKDKMKSIFLILIFYLCLTYLFWPYLWLDPINNLITSLTSFANYGWGGSIFYLGNYVKASNLPWHYSFVWIFVSTPIIYSILFIFALYKILYNFFSNLDYLWKNSNEKLDLFVLSFFLIPLIAVITFNSTLYNGWRHLYFIYPALIYLVAYALNHFLNFNLNKIYRNIILSSIFFAIFINIFNIVKLHPYQNIYFNFLVEKKANTLFDIDYWGLGNASAIKEVLNNLSTSEKISIGTASFTPLNYSRYIIDNKNIKNINFTGTENTNSEYIFTNYVYEGNPKYKKKYLIPKNYNKIYTLVRGNIIINELYKREK